MAISLQRIKGIGPAIAKQLTQLGFNSAEDVAEASADALLSIPGFGKAKASQVIQDAANLVAASTPPNAAICAARSVPLMPGPARAVLTSDSSPAWYRGLKPANCCVGKALATP